MGIMKYDADFVYSEVKWSATLTTEKPKLCADIAESGSLFQSGSGIVLAKK